MTCRSYTLPNELWLSIAFYLPTRSLSKLTITCSHLLALLQPLLFRCVNLAYVGREKGLGILNLLIRDKNLAICITELMLGSPCHDNSLTNLKFLENLVSLEHLKLCRIKFHDEAEVNALNGVLARSNSIKEFTCIDLDQQLVHFRGLRGLKAVTWKGNIAYTFDAMCEVLSDSCTTIETLDLYIYKVSPSQCNRLFSLYFPCLRSLTFGIWGKPPRTGVGFIDFIIAHGGSLEELDIEYIYDLWCDPNCASFGAPSLKPLHEDVLPHLRAFKGCTEQFKIMAEANLRSLSTTLQQLFIDPSVTDSPADDLCEAFDAVDGDLSALLECIFDFDRDEVIDVMKACAMVCGSSLRVLKGLRFPDFDADLLGRLLRLFEKLETVHLGLTPYGGVEIMAAHCQNLRQVYLFSDCSRADYWWTVPREGGDDLICTEVHMPGFHD